MIILIFEKDEGRKKLAECIIKEFCSTVKPVEKVKKRVNKWIFTLDKVYGCNEK